jgi:predicted  nucleic acid-binding Zn-ribbon protein
MEKETADILEVVNFIKDRMATKDDLAELRENMEARFEAADRRFEAIDRRFDAVDARFDAIENRLTSIETELRDIRQRIEFLEQAAHNASGFAKEIDHLIQRVASIEKHLGIEQRIAA